MRKEVECPVSSLPNVKVLKVPCQVFLYVGPSDSVRVIIKGEGADNIRVSQDGNDVWVHGPRSKSGPEVGLTSVEIMVPRRAQVDVRGRKRNAA